MRIITKIKDKLHISEAVRQYLPDGQLTEVKEGVYTCVCPLPGHKDTKPSFRVYDNTGRFYCYGCHKMGDVVDFVTMVESIPTNEAITKLAKQAGIDDKAPLSKHEQEGKKKKDAMKAVAAMYESLLVKNEPAKTYLKGRGFSEETLSAFGVGYSPVGQISAMGCFNRLGLRSDAAIQLGVLGRSEKRSKLYDAMSGRIVFPITALSGHVIAFGGRILDEDDRWGKYKNSANSHFFKKGEAVYGLYQARKEIKSKDRVNLVEGYLDVLAMHQYGLANTVGSMGTAVTAEQLSLLRTMASTIVLIMDGDTAGAKATAKAISLALYAGFNVLVVTIPEQLDPDEYLKLHGPEAMNGLIAAAADGLYMLMNLLDKESPEALTEWITDFLRSQKSRLLAVIWAKRIADFFGVTGSEIISAVTLEATD